MRGRERLASRERWARREYAVDVNGNTAPPTSSTAVAWCAAGALFVCESPRPRSVGEAMKVLDLVARSLFGLGVTQVNDELGYDAVLRMYDEAIKRAPRG